MALVLCFFGDHHDQTYNSLSVTYPFDPLRQDNDVTTGSEGSDCRFDLHIFPSKEMELHYRTFRPILFALLIAGIFMFTVISFLLFDYTVARRQEKVMATAKRTHAVVSSLFPSNVRNRILRNAEEQHDLDLEK